MKGANMFKSGVDQEALITMFSEATAKQGDALRRAVSDATLRALQGRELTMDNIKKVLKTVTDATSTGLARNAQPAVDVEALLGKAVAGMDGALLQAVEANRKALEQFVSQGAELQEKPLKNALDNLEKMEDMFFKTVGKAAQNVGGTLQGPWQQVLEATRMKGLESGTQAQQTVEQLLAQAQQSMRDGRAAGMRTAQAMLDGYAALVSGVLIGMSEGLQGRSASASASAEPAVGTGGSPGRSRKR